MCGINGVILSKVVDSKSIVQKMNDRLAHRGPNGEGIWTDGAVSFGHRRLSIIDLSEAGKQPMVSQCERYVLVMNGEIFNYQDLKGSIKYPYQSNSDSEVVLAAWS